MTPLEIELLENLKRITERVEENCFQENFPSAFKRAKDLIERIRKSNS